MLTLRELLDQMGMTITELSRKTGYSRQAIYPYLDQVNSGNVHTLRALAEAAGGRLVIGFEAGLKESED